MSPVASRKNNTPDRVMWARLAVKRAEKTSVAALKAIDRLFLATKPELPDFWKNEAAAERPAI
ncbi:MAG TPA: hypothetical protein VGP65_03800, partial [Candidatus Angelobacter sp.]|nr:hypothetical protein [Candidatus Angelobacter sp.]